MAFSVYQGIELYIASESLFIIDPGGLWKCDGERRALVHPAFHINGGVAIRDYGLAYGRMCDLYGSE